jgi:hypothetical protein
MFLPQAHVSAGVGLNMIYQMTSLVLVTRYQFELDNTHTVISDI